MRPILAFAIAAGCAVPAAAQQYIPKEFLQAELERQKGIVLKYVDAAPDSMLGFRPTQGVRNYAQQIEHIFQPIVFILPQALGSSSKAPDCGKPEAYLANKALLRDCVSKSFDFGIALIRDLPPEGLTREGEFKPGGRPMKMVGYKWVAGILDHCAWTLGQTVPYLRLNGVTPPAYSPF